MIYLYQCPECGIKDDVIKPIAQIDRKEFCGECEIPMENQLCPPLLTVKGVDAHYSHAFGKIIRNSHDLKETIAETNDKKGMRLEQVGTDKMTSVKRQRKPYVL